MNIVWPKKIMLSFLDSEPYPVSTVPSLTDSIEQARQDWFNAQNYYNSVSDSDLVDHAVYMMQAAEKKYTYLLKKARREGVSYSPYEKKSGSTP